jgi:hypothetical protein
VVAPDLVELVDLQPAEDLVVAEDLAVPADLAAPVDLATPPDLVVASDLVQSVDLAPPPDLRRACPVGRGDCDGEPTNGCEANLTNDENHCGGCDIPASWAERRSRSATRAAAR